MRGTRSLIGRDELIYLSYPNTVDNFSSLLEKLTENPNPFTASSRKKKKKIKHSDEYKTERKKKNKSFFLIGEYYYYSSLCSCNKSN